jgi:hypothetical protein
MEDFDKYLERLVENFFDTGKLVLNEYSDNLHRFFQRSKEVNDQRRDALRSFPPDIEQFDILIESVIEWDGVINILDTIGDDELLRISRGGDKQWGTFKHASNLKDVSDIKDAVKVLQSQYYNEIREYYYKLINKIHEDKKTSENIEEIIGRYENLKVLIEKLCDETTFKVLDCDNIKRRLDDNIIRNSILINGWISKYEEIKTLYYNNRSSVDYIGNIEGYIKNLKDLKADYNLLPPKKKGEIIYYFKFHFANKGGFDYNTENFVDWIDNNINNQEDSLNKDYKVRNTDLIGLDVLEDYLTYKSSITPEQSEESFDKIVDDIDVKKVDDGDLSGILRKYSIDGELVGQRKEILGEIESLNSKITNIYDKREQLKNTGNENWENEGKTKLPQYENEKKNLEEQLRIIDPIKVLFDSDSKWGNNYINCHNQDYVEYLSSYYKNRTTAHNTLLNKYQIKILKEGGKIGEEIDCENYNLEKLTTEIDRVSNRENIKNELTDNFNEYQKNDVITNLVNKSINLVDNIFKMIIDKGIFSQVPLQKYKSYMNMIKIYSQGENQKEK